MLKRNMRTLFFAYILFLIVIAIFPINSASSGALNNIYIITVRLDYLLHSILFIPWIFLYLVTFRPATWCDKLIMIGSGLLMAFATEGIQYFLPYRAYNINDLLANILGILLGSFALFINMRQLRIKK